jgi:hypothetical protein
MVPQSSCNFLSGIWFTQVEYPLPHRQKGVLDRIRLDRLVFLSFTLVADPKDDEVGELVFCAGDVLEVRTFSDGVAEGGTKILLRPSLVLEVLAVDAICRAERRSVLKPSLA